MSYYLNFLQFIQTNRHEFLNNMVWFNEEGNIANFFTCTFNSHLKKTRLSFQLKKQLALYFSSMASVWYQFQEFMKLILFPPKIFCILFVNNMADREARLAHLNQKLDYLRSQSTAQTRLLFQTSDQRTRQAIQENHINLLLEIQHVKDQLRQLGVNPPPPFSRPSTSSQ